MLPRFYHRGQVYFITGDFDRAIVEYRRSSELDPDFIFSHIQLAVAQYKNGATEKAMHQFRKFLKDFSTSPEVFNYYGELLLDQQKYEEAVANFEKAIELDQNTLVLRLPLTLSADISFLFQRTTKRPPPRQPGSRRLPMESRLRRRREDLPTSHRNRRSVRRRSSHFGAALTPAEQGPRSCGYVCAERRDE